VEESVRLGGERSFAMRVMREIERSGRSLRVEEKCDSALT
jgi:hypothetical protein